MTYTRPPKTTKLVVPLSDIDSPTIREKQEPIRYTRPRVGRNQRVLAALTPDEKTVGHVKFKHTIQYREPRQ